MSAHNAIYIRVGCFFALSAVLFLGCASAQAGGAVGNSVGMELLPVKAGKFLYGAPEKTPRPNLWGPRFQIPVTLTKDFCLGKCEVTQAQFEKVMGRNPSQFKGADLPVDSVTWEEAVEFCQKLSALPEEKDAGRVYSLPSSAEWEYACRAGSDSVFPWGNEDETQLGVYAWCHDLYGERCSQSHPVGTKKPNAWGFCDMLGNVWEWCSDGAWSGEMQYGTYYDKAGGWVDPKYPENAGQLSKNKVIRGGGWKSDFRAANCWLVYGQRPLYRDSDTGFRVKYTVAAQEKPVPADAGKK